MFRLWKIAHLTLGYAPLMDAPDAGGGGGDADPDGQGDGSQLSDADADGGDEGAQGAADGQDADREDADEDLIVDDDNEPEVDEHGRTRTAEDRLKAVAKKNRKLRKQLAKYLPLAKRLKDVDLDDLITNDRNYKSLNQQIQRNPRLRALVHGGDVDDEPTGRQTRTPPPEDPAFDETALPFDPNASDANRYFANMAKQNHELNLAVKKLSERLNQFDGREMQRTEQSERGQWKTAIDAAAGHIKDEGVRDLFKDAMAGAYRDRQTHGLPPQRLVDHYLKKLKVNPQEAAKAGAAVAAAAGKTTGAAPSRAATQQRIAEGNRTLPRTVAPTGTPAPARTGRERLADVNKRVRNLAGSAR